MRSPSYTPACVFVCICVFSPNFLDLRYHVVVCFSEYAPGTFGRRHITSPCCVPVCPRPSTFVFYAVHVLAKDMNRWRAVVNSVLNLRVP
jgi:hypothetical protein